MLLAPYACNPHKIKNRLYPEDLPLSCNHHQLDRDKIVHSNAFRRLEYKTQVFMNYEGDHYRNRLTHSMEVAVLARLIARELQVSEDLAEAISLAHDMGHTPFGHAGEHALNKCMSSYGGFDHNAHSIKLLTKLEDRYAAFEGLNLSWEVLEGIAKHNGPLKDELPASLLEYNIKHDLELTKYSSIEAQVAAISDDIAYHCHDIEDGIRAGLLTVDDISTIPLLRDLIDMIKQKYVSITIVKLIYELTRALKHYLVRDLISTARQNILAGQISTEHDVREHNKTLINFSKKVAEENNDIKKLLYRKFYENHKVILMKLKAQHIITNLFELCMATPEFMNIEWQERITDKTEFTKARVVADYIAGMTDRYAIKQYEMFYNITSAKYF